jgi:hypothetical protein
VARGNNISKVNMADKETMKRTIALAGHKFYVDYVGFRDHIGPVEPEGFFDTWMKKYVIRETPEFRSGVWKFFLCELIEAREENRWRQP